MKDIFNEFKELDIAQKLFFIALVILALLFVYIGINKLISNHRTGETQTEEIAKTEEIQNTSKEVSDENEQNNQVVYYSEGDEDGSYNYIINGDDFLANNTEMPYYYYMDIPGLLNEKLKAGGYTARQLTFIEGNLKGTEYTAVFSISESNDIVKVISNIGLNDYKITIETN